MNMQYIQPGTYEHYKGSLVEVLFIAKHSETLEPLVVYKHLEDNEVSDYWVRPLSMFLEMVTVDGKEIPRFKRIDNHS